MLSLWSRSKRTSKRCPTASTTSVSKAAPVGVEQAVERPADPIIGKMGHLFYAQSKQTLGKAMHRLALTVYGFAFDDERAQQHAQRAGMQHGTASVGGGDVLVEQRLQVDSLEEECRVYCYAQWRIQELK